MTIDRHEIRATIAGQPVRVLTAETTLDRGWAPYAQGRLTIVAPAMLELLDPRRREQVTVRLVRRFSESESVAQVSARHAGKTVGQVSAQHAGKTVDQMSAAYRNAWNPAGPHGAARPRYLVGWLTSAQRTFDDPNTYEIEWCGDEERAITRLAATKSWSPNASTVRGIVANALGFAGLDQTLGGSVDADVPVDEDGRSPVWLAGVSCWDYLDPIVSACGMRLYADERGDWQLVDADETVGTVELGDAVTAGGEAWATDNKRFYDHAVILYEWETQAGVRRSSIDSYALGSVAGYTERVQGRPAGDGRAQAIVERAQKRALAQQWEAIADYSIHPGQVATITPAGVSGVVDAVTFSYPDARAKISLIDVSTL